MDTFSGEAKTMKRIIVANWKLNPSSPREAQELWNRVKRVASALKRTETVICPPVIFLGLLGKSYKASASFALGAQDAFWALEGPWTGQIGPGMVRRAGGQYLLLGHSEKRVLGDSDQIINQKLKLALAQDLRVILCVGERERDNHGEYLKVIREQIISALEKVPKKFSKQIIIAYEPVWAIGEQAKNSDTPHSFLETAIFIRKVLSHWCGHASALAVPVLYGGSVDVKNASSFLSEGGADGLLVGRASLRADHFTQILKIADALPR